MLSLLLVLSLHAAPQATRVLAIDLTATNVEPKLAGFFTSELAMKLSLAGVSTVTRAELATLISLDAQKKLLGCPDDHCLGHVAETSTPFDAVLTGTVMRAGKKLKLSVRVIKGADGAVVAAGSSTGSSEEELLKTMPAVAEALATQLAKALPPHKN